MNLLADFHFLRPLALLLLLAPVVLWLARRAGGGAGGWAAHCDAELLAHLVVTHTGSAARTPRLLLLAGWTLAVLALAGPTFDREQATVYRSQHARVVVLDLSRSMDAVDVAPSRLTRARFKTADLLARSADGQAGLVVFAGDAFAIAPLTEDVNTLLNLLPTLATDLMPVQGSRADLGIELALTLLRRTGVPDGEIILIGDGVDERAVQVAAHVRAAGHRLGVLAVGTIVGAPIPTPGGGFLEDAAGAIVMPGVDLAALRQVAERGGGPFTTLTTDDTDIERLTTNSTLRADAGRSEHLRTSSRWLDRGPWLLLPLLPLAALAFRRGWLLSLALLLMLPPATVQAFDWAELWRRPEQRVAEHLREGDNAAAVAASRRAPESWRGAALYRSGEFEAAAQAFASAAAGDAADGRANPVELAHYNLGNALARAGRLPEAIAAYDEAISHRPDFDDAEFNRELVRQLLEQQSAPQAEPGDGEQGGDSSTADESAPEAGGETGQAGNEQPDGRRGPDAHSGESPASSTPGDMSDATPAYTPAPTRQAADGDDAGEPTGPDSGVPPEGAEPSQAGESTRADGAQSLSEVELEQWLRRVPDDPGGLLRRKFALEHSRRERERVEVSKPW